VVTVNPDQGVRSNRVTQQERSSLRLACIARRPAGFGTAWAAGRPDRGGASGCSRGRSVWHRGS